MNDAILCLLGLCVLLLSLAIFYLVHRLANTNSQAIQWADTCMKQTLAFNEDQRAHMRDKMELERTPVAPPPDRVVGEHKPKTYQPVHPLDVLEAIQNGTEPVVPYGGN